MALNSSSVDRVSFLSAQQTLLRDRSLSNSSQQRPEIWKTQYLTLAREKRKLLMEAVQTSSAKAIAEFMVPTPPGSQRKAVRRLFDLATSIDEHNNTLLHLAVAYNDLALIYILLLKGAPVNMVNHGGVTPLRISQLLQLEDAKTLLLKHGALSDYLPLSSQEEGSDDAALHHSTSTTISSSTASGAISSRSRSGTTSSGAALPALKVRYPQSSFIGSELHHGAGLLSKETFSAAVDLSPENLDACDGRSVNSLMKACARGNAEAVKILLAKGAKLHLVDINGQNVLWYACIGGSFDVVQLIVQTLLKWAPQVLTQTDTFLLAAIYSGRTETVAYLLSLESMGKFRYSAETKANCTILAILLAQVDCVHLLAASNVQLSSNVREWLYPGMAQFECMESILDMSNTEKQYPIYPASVLPGKECTTLTFANQKLEELLGVLGLGLIGRDRNTQVSDDAQALKILIKSQEERLMDYLKSVWGARISSQVAFEMDPPESNEKFFDDLRASIGDQTFKSYREEIESMKPMFQQKGTILDELHIQLVQQVIRLLSATEVNSKSNYIAIAGKAISTAGEITMAIEQTLPFPTLTNGKPVQNAPIVSNYSTFQSSLLYTTIRDLLKTLRNGHVKNMLLVTRIAVGAWPPPDAVPNMIKQACQMARSFKHLVNLANASGYWVLGKIDLATSFRADAIASSPLSPNMNTPTTTGNTSNLSYLAYQKQQEAHLLEQLSGGNRKPIEGNSAFMDTPLTMTTTMTETSSITDTQSSELSVVEKDKMFFNNLDNLIRCFVVDVQRLKKAKDIDSKNEFVAISSSIYSRVDGIMDEIMEYYLFKNAPEDFCLVEGQPTFKKTLFSVRQTCLDKANSLVFKSKLASGVWPPPNSTNEMIQASAVTAVAIKKAATYARKAAQMIRKVEDRARNKVEDWMQEWKQNTRVRNLFNQWESLQIAEHKIKNNVQEETTFKRLNMSEVPPDLRELMEDSNDGLVFETKEDKTIIKAGKLVRLVERLADNKLTDFEYRDAFLLTHHSFTTSLDLLDLLMKRYDLSPPYGLDQRSFEIFVNHKVIPVRLRVYNVLKIWMSKYTEDFTRNHDLIKRCIDFVQTKMTLDFGEITGQLLMTLRNYLQVDKTNTYVLDPNKQIQKANLPNKVPMDKLYLYLTMAPRNFMEIDPAELARQMTLIELNVYRNIRAKECLDQGWEKPDKQQRSPNVTKMIQHTNNVTNWVATIIVECEDIKTRVNLIKYFISVAAACREINNFNALTAIIAGLSMGPLHRMTKTWNVIRDKNNKVNEQLEALMEIVSAKGQYANYRRILKSSSTPVIPFLGVFLTDLTFVDLGNPDYIPESNLINFDKRRKVAAIISDVLSYQSSTYYFETASPIHEFLQTLSPENGWHDEKTMYKISLKSEPREESDENDS